MGLALTGKSVVIAGMAFSRVADGRIVEQWDQADMLGLIQQLGALLDPG